MADQEMGISRRTMVKRSAVIGGAIWAAPAITTYGSKAFGQVGTPAPGGQDISFVAVKLECGGQTYRVKWEEDTGFQPVCNPTFSVDSCGDQLGKDDPNIVDDCPEGVFASFNSSNGSLTVDLGNCTLVDYVVKCGVPSDAEDQGCIDPGQNTNQPSVPATGIVTFNRCQLA